MKTLSLLKDGELGHGAARDLLKRGWGLKILQNSEEALAAIAGSEIGVPSPGL